MADLACPAVATTQELAIDDHRRTDPATEREHAERRRLPPGAEQMLGECEGVDIIVDPRRGSGQARDQRGNRHILPAEPVATQADTPLGIVLARHRKTDPDQPLLVLTGTVEKMGKRVGNRPRHDIRRARIDVCRESVDDVGPKIGQRRPEAMLHQLDAEGDVSGVVEIEPRHPASPAVSHRVALGDDLLFQEFRGHVGNGRRAESRGGRDIRTRRGTVPPQMVEQQQSIESTRSALVSLQRGHECASILRSDQAPFVSLIEMKSLAVQQPGAFRRPAGPRFANRPVRSVERGSPLSKLLS